MKTKLFALHLIFAIATTTVAKAQSFSKAQVDINAGIGFGTTFINGAGIASTLPPLSISVDYGVTDQISVGGYFGITGDKWTYTFYDACGLGNSFGNANYYTTTTKWTFAILGVRGEFHFAKYINVDKLDVYAGLMLGYNIESSSYTTNDPCTDYIYLAGSYGGFAWSIFAGARYRFTDHFGAFLELGYGIDILTIGLNYKI